MRVFAVLAAALAVVSASAQAEAAARKNLPVVIRSAHGTVIQPTRTIIRNPNGSVTVIEVPRRSYLDTGTEVAVGDRSFRDYVFPPGGDPGRPYWNAGPDVQGKGRYPLPGPGGMELPGLNPYSPF